MSTRGLFMIRKDGEDKGVYIPHDAYPNVAGEAIYDFLHSVGVDLERVYKRMTDDDGVKAPELDTFLITAVNQNGLLYYNEDKDFIYDSLMCEHAYIINLDDDTLEYYIGYQEKPQEGNRYSGKVSSIGTYTGKTYYSCKLAAVFTLEYVKNTSKQDLINKMYSQLVKINAPVVETKRKPFTPEEIKALWDISSDRMVQVVLIYLYTGFRLKELMLLPSCQVDLKEMVIQGGEKTAAGKNRLVPIHPRIEPFIREMVSNEYLITNPDTGTAYKENVFYNQWNEVMKRINATHTPHECRHTFETLLDNAGGNRKCIDMLMGHKSLDVGNRVYNHKTLEQLRETILLLK